ncbi:MAG: hypothetical protein KatS3mg131_0130 [Candidatus Tectimicrobiota bacterium]|nr:MAG: hypothetical protein KatS3mg131_0130 [Candidatus Tectomicrobia bacterium]
MTPASLLVVAYVLDEDTDKLTLIGNEEGLLALKRAIEAALASGMGHAEVDKARSGRRERYEIEVILT